MLTPAVGQRSSGQENQGRSTGHHARSVQMRARQLNSSTLKAATTSKSANTRRLPVKSVRWRCTQLNSIPIPISAGVRSLCSLLTPNIQQAPPIHRRLQETSLESTSLAWNHFRSLQLLDKLRTPGSRRPLLLKLQVTALIFLSVMFCIVTSPIEEMQSIVMSVCFFDCLPACVYLSDCISQKPYSWTLQILMCMLPVAMAQSFCNVMISTFGFVDDDDFMISYILGSMAHHLCSSAVRV